MNHADLIKDAEAISAHLGVSIHTVRSWRQRESIPAQYWPKLVEADFASLEVLAQTARPRKPPQRKAA